MTSGKNLKTMTKGGYTYIMSSPNRGSLYIGVTSNLEKRAFEHRLKVFPTSFTCRYNCVVLVYYAHFTTIEEAILEEKRLKGSSRKYKETLIDGMNPGWEDLYDRLA
jgi:putative endonuclease